MSDNRKLYALLRNFSLNVKPWDSAIYHDVRPDEHLNAPLIAMNVYGDAQMFHVIMACAGLDSIEQPIKDGTIALPQWSTYLALERQANG